MLLGKQKPDFAILGINYITLKCLSYKNLFIPKGFIFDGVTVKAPFTLLFSNKDLRKGILASCFHDYMCRHKDIYKRKDATKVLIDLWIKEGLPKWKSYIVFVCVELYQFCCGWR